MGIEAALIGGGASLLGGILGGNSAQSAANTQAQAQLEAARIAADAAKFRPVGVTTAFGSSNFTKDAEGNLATAGYTLSPQLAAQRDAFLAQMGGSGQQWMQQAGAAGQGLFNLGQGYLAQSPEAAGQQWMAAQQAALAPGQEQQLAAIRNNLFNTGRSGLAVGATDAGGLAASNPEMAAYYNSLQRTNLDLAAQAQQQGRAQTQFGQGLLGQGIDLVSAGFNPYTKQLAAAQTLEGLGQGALTLGTELGGRVTSGAAQAGNLLSQGMTSAAGTRAAAASDPYGAALTAASGNKALTSGLAGMFSTPYGGTPQGAYGQQDQYLAGAYANPQTQQATMLNEQNSWFL